ncbi:enoyl-CoA hydratase-related protein [Burkholderia multivorans]|uniref:Enoyl-CoA hydratase n=1 Tax=Burkholderia multivorans TaxID=87883 RepID=A0AB37AWV9_9BURK|nr:enoyl-CoA hydratase-related protein [Burkholderia multivorans]MBU9346561.1 enoyl-CoA hydratase/isomerase family protein [Burkholderia multivorans]MCO1383855.1 enoyl-CoA hydratase-related protein [Burkholderia multivorans]MCO1400548.1 enoyl-CoA hydratase-related protein [Burkholderia multivorans]MDN7969731.1 enoyl-CoA hydratase-related protein [Burkholderia multivorans]PRE50435.1 enoyl-CoA hydratase [Burkholderia multivorans]
MTGNIEYLAKDGRAYITINRPEKKNAMTNAMLDALMVCYDRAEADDDVRVVVLRGAGDDFSTGHDLAEVGKEYGETTYDDKGRPRKPSQRARLLHDKRYIERFERVFRFLKPTLSLVKGYCLGAGLYLAEGSDLVIAADTAKMGHPEQKLGLSGAAYFAAWEMMVMGPRKARELLLMAEVWDAQTCLANGLVNKVVPAASLDEAGEEWAERIARLPRDGIVVGKAATNLAMDSLGLASQFSYGHVLHALATNVRYESDEYNFMKQRRDKGVRASNHERESFYDTKEQA